MNIDFSKFKLDLSNDEQESMSKTGGGSGFRSLKPGTHSVKIKSVEWKGAPDNDKTWNKLRIAYADESGAEASEILLIPTTNPRYGERATLVPYQKLVETLKVLGFDITNRNAAEMLGKVFRNEQNLVGLSLIIKADHRSPYLNFVGKGEILLVDAKNSETIETFSTKEEAVAYCSETNIVLSKYVEIMRREAPAVKNNLSKFTVSAVKKFA